jgi:hypothetical protein
VGSVACVEGCVFCSVCGMLCVLWRVWNVVCSVACVECCVFCGVCGMLCVLWRVWNVVCSVACAACSILVSRLLGLW